MKLAIVALLGLTQSIQIKNKDDTEPPVWRDHQPDLYKDDDSVTEVDAFIA